MRGVEWTNAVSVENWGWYPGEAMARLFGSTLQQRIELQASGPESLREALDSGYIVTIGTRDNYTNSRYVTSSLYKLHAYAVSSVRRDAAGSWLVDLYNPHGVDVTVSWKELMLAVDTAVRA